MAKVYDRVQETTLTTGIGSFELAGAVPGYRSFGTIVPAGTEVHYVATFGDQWEVGVGTYNDALNILSRNAVAASTNGGLKVAFPAGVKYIFIATTSHAFTDIQTSVADAVGRVDQFESRLSTFVTVPAGVSTKTGAIILPVGNEADRPAAPTTGMIRFNIVTETVELYTGVAWEPVTGGAAGGGITFSRKTAAYTMLPNEGVLADSTGGAFTLTLPAGPLVGDVVEVVDSGGQWTANPVTLARNGNTIAGLAEDLILDMSGSAVRLIYDGTSWDVYPLASGTGGSALTPTSISTMTNKTINFADNTLLNVASINTPQTLTEKTINAATLTGTTFVDGAVRSRVTAIPALNIDCSVSNYFTKTISGSSVLTVSNVPTGAYEMILEITHTAGTITWFSGVQWPGNVAPTLSSGNTHLFRFITDDGGAKWRGIAQANYIN